MSTTPKLWAWHWVGGGYNSCRAKTRQEAIKKARTMSTLRPNLDTLRPMSTEEFRALERSYGPFD